MEAVKFLIDGNIIYFEDTPENCVSLLTDDEFAIDYVTRAVSAQRLITYGITMETLGQIEIVRATNQPHAPEAMKIVNERRGNVPQESELNENKNPCVEKSSEGTDIVWKLNKKNPRDHSATLLLLELRNRDDYKKYFNDKKHTKSSLWLKIAKELQNAGFKLSDKGDKDAAEKVRQKFANLQKTYNAFMDNMRSTGSDYAPKPLYFDEMREIFSNKDNSNPPFLIDSFQEIPIEKSVFDVDAVPSTSTQIPAVPSGMETPKTSKNNCIGGTERSSIYASTKSSVRPKKNVLSVIEDLHKNQMKEINNITQTLKAHFEKQNEILETQSGQRGELINILKALCSSKTSDKSKKRRRGSSSSSE